MATNPSAIQAWAAAEQPVLDSIAAAINSLAAGVQALDNLITTLQNSPGQITAADQATLDAAQAQSKALLAQLQAISTTPPGTPVPVTPQP